MKYDVFISYSRKDSKEVNLLIDLLRYKIPGIKIWYDNEGIESADAFKRKIISAINESETVIFVCSDNSLASEYCEKEVTYAKNVGKRVIPFLLKGSELKDWLLFDFGHINCIHAEKGDEVYRMVQDLRRWVEKREGNDTASDSENEANPYKIDKEHKELQLEFDPQSGEFHQKGSKETAVLDANDLEDQKDKDAATDLKELEVKSGFINGHEYVDLGLPSGLKWATFNLGASKPEDDGEYFSWGETVSKTKCSKTKSETGEKSIKWLTSKGYLDDNGNLTLIHDAARENWGWTWRMPTKAEIEELVENTTTEWTKVNGVFGRLVKSKRNKNSIFLPAAGWRQTSWLSCYEEHGRYWSSTPSESETDKAFSLSFSETHFKCYPLTRYFGAPIRPVSE